LAMAASSKLKAASRESEASPSPSASRGVVRGLTRHAGVGVAVSENRPCNCRVDVAGASGPGTGVEIRTSSAYCMLAYWLKCSRRNREKNYQMWHRPVAHSKSSRNRERGDREIKWRVGDDAAAIAWQ
jgi:hypothetical protein